MRPAVGVLTFFILLLVGAPALLRRKRAQTVEQIKETLGLGQDQTQVAASSFYQTNTPPLPVGMPGPVPNLAIPYWAPKDKRCIVGIDVRIPCRTREENFVERALEISWSCEGEVKNCICDPNPCPSLPTLITPYISREMVCRNVGATGMITQAIDKALYPSRCYCGFVDNQITEEKDCRLPHRSQGK
eukprot:gnl/Spiro4/5355_TR2721_c0_g2_i1.p1 gnl/Spiro4/5355_TR2721_c0_g2~~gnl/Spiro4/5355_TR2721_c0_g2_i1.p1  ORF type:complete len:197 (+),score=49.55 gnl/Spiro4/5355_TR2721_c0_g2_i1:30-593(+)